VQVKEVGNAGLLLRISLTINGEETHFHTVSENDNQKVMKRKRRELLLYAEFISLEKPDYIWADIRDGSFYRYLDEY
jgi:hypothetical protein